MSFDVFLISFRDGEKATADAVAARRVLERCRYDHSPEFSGVVIHFDDGSDVELYAGGLLGGDEPFDGGMFALHGMSDAIAGFIFEFSRAAGCAIFPAMEPACVTLPREDLVVHLPADLGAESRRIVVASGEELRAALEGGYEAWRAYRDRVVGRG